MGIQRRLRATRVGMRVGIETVDGTILSNRVQSNRR